MRFHHAVGNLDQSRRQHFGSTRHLGGIVVGKIFTSAVQKENDELADPVEQISAISESAKTADVAGEGINLVKQQGANAAIVITAKSQCSMWPISWARTAFASSTASTSSKPLVTTTRESPGRWPKEKAFGVPLGITPMRGTFSPRSAHSFSMNSRFRAGIAG
jgi:hypothetical protein